MGNTQGVVTPALRGGLEKNTKQLLLLPRSPRKAGMTAITFILLFLLLFFPSFSYAENMVQAELVSLDNNRLGVALHHPEGWHTYYKDAGDAGIPTALKWTLPEGFSAGEIDWPKPQIFKEGELTTYGYTGDVTLPVTITKTGDTDGIIKVKASWLACKDICIPEEQELSYNPAGGAATAQDDSNQQPETRNYSLFATIALAILGGLVLNFMPCVLPVLSLKAFSLLKKSGKHRSETVMHGVAYTMGILVSFAGIAAILLALQKAGEAVGWGYQMQFPAFVGFLVYLLFAVGLSLSGAFHLPVLLGGVGVNLTNEQSIRGSFFTGVLAALVATPCTAPFMASAVGAALTMSAPAAMLVFLALGLGLALPFLLISIFPACLKFLPKQGAWMEKFKEFLAFPIYASVIWLVWVLGLQAGAGAVAIILSGMLLLVFALWSGKTWLKKYHFFVLIIAIVLMGFSLLNISVSDAQNTEDSYSKQKLTELRASGKSVYVDATAAWCITCQVNKRVVLENENVRAAFERNNVTLLIADWTRQNPEITDFLYEFGYNGVPLNVFYPAGNSAPIVLPQILSEKAVIETISR